MQIMIIILSLIFGFFFGSFAHADFTTAESFMKKTDCLTCHSRNQKLVGPSFQEMAQKYSSSPETIQKLTDKIKRGGSGAWGSLPMPPHPTLSDSEIKTMVTGILSLTSHLTSLTSGAETSKLLEQASEKDVALGRDLFQGKVRFQHQGTSCNSCHHVKNDAVIGGGILARDLTSVFSRLGAPGVKAILGKPPFPVMEDAYQEHPLTEKEVYALVAFLNRADQEHAFQKPKDYGMGLFLSGLFGVILMFLFYSVIGFRRKKRSVNQTIYDRQIKSQ